MASPADAFAAVPAAAQVHALLDPEHVGLLALHERFTRRLLRDLARGAGAA